MQDKKQHLVVDMELWTVSKLGKEKTKKQTKLGKEYVSAVYCHPTYLTYMQSTS